MMNSANILQDAIQHWLRPDNMDLKQAIDRSVKENLFSFEDIKHRILMLKQTLNNNDISLISNRFNGINLSEKKVLVFHPANIPLCGIEDLLTVILSGAQYLGKLSRRDPWLFRSFLNSLNEAGFQNLKMNTDANYFNQHLADAVIFSGSNESAKLVSDLVFGNQMVNNDAPQLIRTTWFSIAYVDTRDSETWRDLIEAIFRYQGFGCRSVATVVAPFSLDSVKCELTDYIEEFWLSNPPHKKPSPSLFHRYAYNKSAGHQQAWLDHFLIEQTQHSPDSDFLLHWIVGDTQEVNRVAQTFQNGLQTIYTTTNQTDIPGNWKNRDLLSNAQKPALGWTPDGIDTSHWLIQNIGS